METVAKKHAQAPLVLALDIGSSATRGRICDAAGHATNKLQARIRHALTAGPGGALVGDAEQLCVEAVQIIDQLIEDAGKHAASIAGVALDSFASTIVGVDAKGKALTPLYTYADAQPVAQVEHLQATLDERAIQQRTGCRLHSSYLPARLLWLQETQPKLMPQVAYWLSLGEFIYLRLLGQRAASFSTAAWSGLLNRHTLTWDREWLDLLGVREEQFSPLRDTTEPLIGLTPDFAKRWPALAAARWFPAVADGFASTVGSDARDAQTCAVSLGTSGAARVLLPDTPAEVPEGLWCYRVDRRQSLLGGALNDGGRVIDWARRLLAPIDEVAIANAPPSDATPVVLPFLTGERSPGWATYASASISGLTAADTAASVFRGLLEGLALRMDLIIAQLRSAAPRLQRVVASGGAVERLPHWLQMLADCSGLPVIQALEGQTTLRGTALIALDVLAPTARRVPVELDTPLRPVLSHAETYRRARVRQADAYGRLIKVTPTVSPPAAVSEPVEPDA